MTRQAVTDQKQKVQEHKAQEPKLKHHYDVVVIGGGIHGVSVATEAAALGLQTALFEADDIAAGASSATSGLFSGDIRQLENLSLENVRNNLVEQARACQRAPHLVRPKIFALLDNLDVRSHKRVRSGCFLYRGLQTLKISQDNFHCPRAYLTSPFLTDTGNRIHTYTDCLLNGSRYTLSQALAAKQQGADIFTHHRLTEAQRINESKRWRLQLETQNKDTLTTTAGIIINATGADISELLEQVIQRRSRCHIKRFGGGNLIVRKPNWPQQCFTLQDHDGRLVTITPYHHGLFLIGSSQSPQLHPSPELEQNLIDLVNHHLQDKLSTADIVHRNWAIRAIYDDPTCNDISKSRQYFLDLDCPDGHSPLLNIFGGSLASHRLLAIQALRILQPHTGKATNDKLANTALPGGDFTMGDFPSFLQELQNSYSQLPHELLKRLANNYGTLSYKILDQHQTIEELGRDFGHQLYEQEVRYLCEQEWAQTAEDILFRRTHLGLVFSEQEKENLQNWLEEHQA